MDFLQRIKQLQESTIEIETSDGCYPSILLGKPIKNKDQANKDHIEMCG